MKEIILKTLHDNNVLKEAQLSLNVMSLIGPGKFDSIDYFTVLDELIHSGLIQCRFYSVHDKVYRIYFDSTVVLLP